MCRLRTDAYVGFTVVIKRENLRRFTGEARDMKIKLNFISSIVAFLNLLKFLNLNAVKKKW